MDQQFPKCEHCQQCNSLWYVIFPNLKGFPYLQVCKICVANIACCVGDLKEMCDDDDGKYPWTGKVYDGSHELLWSEERGQLFNPDIEDVPCPT